MNKISFVKGYVFAVASAVLYGLMPLMANYVYAEGVNAQTLVALRNLLPLPILAVLALKEQKNLKIPLKAIPSFIAIGLVGMCITPALLFSAYTHIDSSTATVLHFIYPAFVVVGGIIFLKEKATKSGFVSILLCAVGILLFYDPKQPLNLTGAALALLSGVTCAAYVLLLASFKYKSISAFAVSFYVSLFGGGFSLIYCLITNTLALPQTPLGWGLSVLFALSITVGAVLLYQQSIFIIGGARASILSTLEPITSLVAGVMILGEKPTFLMLVGSALVIAASLVITISDFKKKKSGV